MLLVLGEANVLGQETQLIFLHKALVKDMNFEFLIIINYLFMWYLSSVGLSLEHN